MSEALLRGAALLITAALFGGMLLFASSFAAFLFKVLPVAQARALIRKAFPPFYLFVIGAAGLAVVPAAAVDATGAALLGAIALSTVPARQRLMPAINDATDRGERQRFVRLHALSVAVTLLHIVLAAVALMRLAR